jgi:hypothetical protein
VSATRELCSFAQAFCTTVQTFVESKMQPRRIYTIPREGPHTYMESCATGRHTYQVPSSPTPSAYPSFTLPKRSGEPSGSTYKKLRKLRDAPAASTAASSHAAKAAPAAKAAAAMKRPAAAPAASSSHAAGVSPDPQQAASNHEKKIAKLEAIKKKVDAKLAKLLV